MKKKKKITRDELRQRNLEDMKLLNRIISDLVLDPRTKAKNVGEATPRGRVSREGGEKS